VAMGTNSIENFKKKAKKKQTRQICPPPLILACLAGGQIWRVFQKSRFFPVCIISVFFCH